MTAPDESRLALAMRKIAELERELQKERLDHIATLGQCQEARAEVVRLRRELEYAIEAARENGKERDELAFKLGEEVAENARLRALLKD